MQSHSLKLRQSTKDCIYQKLTPIAPHPLSVNSKSYRGFCVSLPSLCQDSGLLDIVQVYICIALTTLQAITKTYQTFFCIYAVGLSISYNMRSNKNICVSSSASQSMLILCPGSPETKRCFILLWCSSCNSGKFFFLLGYDKRYSEKQRSHKLYAECLLCQWCVKKEKTHLFSSEHQ